MRGLSSCWGGCGLGIGAVALSLLGVSASAEEIPDGIIKQLPAGYAVFGSASSKVDAGRVFYFVALGSKRELNGQLALHERAPARPLLIFEHRSDGSYRLAGRNDEVVLRADDAGLAGNGCDPFEDHHIAVRGAYFTIENGVACGAHWTDYVTFRFDPQLGGYAFDSWRFQSWKANPSNDPDAEALIPDVHHVVRSQRHHPIAFADWRRPD